MLTDREVHACTQCGTVVMPLIAGVPKRCPVPACSGVIVYGGWKAVVGDGRADVRRPRSIESRWPKGERRASGVNRGLIAWLEDAP